MTFLKLLLSSIIYLAVMAIARPMDDGESKIKGVEIDESKIVRSVLNDKSSNISDYIFPIRYEIKLLLQNNYLQSECIITLNISYAKQYINIYVPDSTHIIESKLKKINGMIYEKESINPGKNNTVLLDFGDVLLSGLYDLYIDFRIPFHIARESFGIPSINTDEQIEWSIATGIQRRNGNQMKKQQIFPYLPGNKPELRINFLISIMHNPKYKALSNMPIQDTELTNDNMMWTYFHETSLISIDSVALLVTDFRQSIFSDGETIRSSIWFRQSESHLEFAETVIMAVSEYMSEWNIYGIILEDTSVSFESKVDHVAIPDLQDAIKHTLGFIFYREADITYNEELDPVAYKTIITRLIARGIVQKYISNLFKPIYLWLHTWLNKGFNIFYQSYTIDKALPNSRMMDLFVVQVQHELLYLNTYIVINSTIQYNSYPENYFHSSLSYIEGSIIWRMLERTLPPNIFLRGFKKYLNNPFRKLETRTSNHLWNAMKSEMFKVGPEYDFNIKNAIESWIMQRCSFELEVTRKYSSVYVTVKFHNKSDEKQYHIPVTYTTESTLDFTATWTIFFSLTPFRPDLLINLEKDEWIIFNLQQAGYYRVNYDTANWRKIAQYLNSEKYSNIHVLNRAQIINDAFHFAIEKKLEFSVFWKLASYLEQERDYIAWYPMLKAFEILSSIFPFLDIYPEFKGVLKFYFMQNFTFSDWNLYDKNNINDHTKCLNQELAKWECIINENACEKKSKYHLEWHLTNSKENKILPGWKRWTYCNGLKTANRNTWNKVTNNYMKGNDTILECLAYSKNSEIIIQYLKKIKLSQIIIKLNQLGLKLKRAHALNANIFLSVIERHTKYMLTSLLNNYNSIRHGEVNEIATLIVIINNAYSKGQLDEIEEFVEKELKISIISKFKYKIETRRSEIEKQRKYFRDLFI